MSPTEPNNGKTFKIIQTILLGLVLLFFVIDRLVIPQVTVARAAETSAQAAEKVAESLSIERRLTALETNYGNIEKLLQEIKADLRQHRETGK